MKIIRYTQPNINNACNPQRGNFDSLFNGLDTFFAWPQVATQSFDTREDENHYHLRWECPGLKRDELKLSVVDQVLTIKGQKKAWKGNDEQGESLERSFTLPDQVQTDKIEAVYEDGVLLVTLPKREEVKPKEIEIRVK
jgi:HSP20 family protein